MENAINSFIWRNNSITGKQSILVHCIAELTQAKGFPNLNINRNFVCMYTYLSMSTCMHNVLNFP